jgi:putative oxidoreductase
MTTPTSYSARLRSAYALLVTLVTHLQSPLLLALRLYCGWQFMQTGFGKVTHLSDTTEYFASLHIPLPGLNAAMAGATECVGGTLLLLGLISRLAALPLIATMIVAYLTAEIDTVKVIFSDPDKFIGATPFLFLLTSLLVLAFGPGRFSLDRRLGFEPTAKIAAPTI